MTLSSDPIAPRDTAYGRWLTARQVHSEDRFHLVRPGLDFASMGRGNFARDIQSESEAVALVVSARSLRVALQGVKHLVQRRSLDGGARSS